MESQEKQYERLSVLHEIEMDNCFLYTQFITSIIWLNLLLLICMNMSCLMEKCIQINATGYTYAYINIVRLYIIKDLYISDAF